LFADLKAKQLHNTSWSDKKNIIAIKNDKRGAKQNQPVTSSIFNNLHDLSIVLDANSATEDLFVATAERIKQKSVDQDDSPRTRMNWCKCGLHWTLLVGQRDLSLFERKFLVL
jgi:hypothetical protein